MTRISRQGSGRFFIILMAGCLLTMLGSSLVQRFLHPSLTIHILDRQPGHVQQENAVPQNMELIGKLMQEVAANPQDGNKTISLVEALMQAGQWQVAENFAQKALGLAGSNDSRPLYLLAIIHHNKGEHAQAAELLEKTLEKGENASARYSLGILYLHFLNKPEQGIAELRKGLAISGLPESLRNAIQEELDKAAQGQSLPEEGQTPAQ